MPNPLCNITVKNSESSSFSIVGVMASPATPGPLGYSCVNDPIYPGDERLVLKRFPGPYLLRAIWDDSTEEHPHFTEVPINLGVPGNTYEFNA